MPVSWKGMISFGLVNIPVMLINSENKSEKISFHLIDKRDHARIKYQYMNSETGKIVNWEDIGKGYQYDKEHLIPVNENELKRVFGVSAKTIAIENFIKKEYIRLIDIDKTYYLIPQGENDKGYIILREALKNENKVGIAKVVISTKEYLAAISAYEEALVLYLLRYSQDIKPLSELRLPSSNLKHYNVSSKELEVAEKLIATMTSAWKPLKYKDEYANHVHQWAERKMQHKSIPKGKVVTSTHTATVINFVDLLRKSVAKVSSRGHAKKKVIRKQARR